VSFDTKSNTFSHHIRAQIVNAYSTPAALWSTTSKHSQPLWTRDATPAKMNTSSTCLLRVSKMQWVDKAFPVEELWAIPESAEDCSVLASRKSLWTTCAWEAHRVMLCLKDFHKVFLSQPTTSTRRNTWLYYSSDKRKCISICNNYRPQGSRQGCRLVICQTLYNLRLGSFRHGLAHELKTMTDKIRAIHSVLWETVKV
jgi:hypothetical protein